MKTNLYCVAAVVALLGFAGAAFSQGLPSERNAAGDSTRPDGTRPADGAIKGGSILPGENAGVPSDKSDKAQNRCNDLNGTLREQCLAQEQGASTGGTRVPDADIAKPPPTREAPPPQNPR
jgi:hypothetical protein